MDSKKEKYSTRKKSSSNNATLLYGKVPPQAVDLENAVLGSIMLEGQAFLRAFEILKWPYFYVEANQRIFKTFQALKEKGSPIDLLTVVESLKQTEELDLVGGPFYVTKLTNHVVSSANIETHCRIILQKFIQREVIRISGESLSEAYEDNIDIFDLLHEAENKLKAINEVIADTSQVNISKISLDVVVSLANKVHNAKEGIVDPNAVYTGFQEWDAINGQLFPGLFVIAARPGMGKGVHMTECVARMGQRYPVGVINGEMTNKQFIIRLGCNLLSIDNFLWKRNPEYITDDELIHVHNAMGAVNDLLLFLDDSTYIDKIVNKIRLWVLRNGVKAVFIDFLQMLSVPDDKGRYMTEVDRLNFIMEKLRALCKELNVTIFLYSQLNRELYKRGGHEPNLSDLKGSGKIEEFAYQISFLHRPEYYDKEAVVDEMGESTKGLMYQIIAKHREGETARLKHLAKLAMSQIKEWNGNLVEGWSDETPF